MAEALNEMNGRSPRADELWIACASKVLPVPVSPRRTTGTSDSAANTASCRQRAMEGLLVVKSSSLSLERLSFIGGENLLLQALAQLPNGLKGIFNEGSCAGNDVCTASHSDAQRQYLPLHCDNFILVE